jgi:allantoinase
MSLPDDYLTYPRRAYGMDQSLYAWRPAEARVPVMLAGGASVAAMIVVPIEHHMINPAGKPFKHPGAMVTAYPDLRHYTTRDYGNRVGVFRILDALAAAGIRATFPINAHALDRLAPLVEAIGAEGHEIAAYGLATDRIHWSGLDEGTEDAWIAEVRARFEAKGLAPKTWLSPARQQSFQTLELLARHGFTTCLDWEQDEVPVAMTTPGGTITAVPLMNELDDRTLLVDRRQTEEDWSAQIAAATACLSGEADRFGARVLSFTLTPYVSGQPFRMWAVRAILDRLAEDEAVWAATASDVAGAFA